MTYGRVAMLLELAHSFAPGLYERFAADAFAAGNFGDAPAQPSAGNVLRPPSGPYGVDGGWRRHHRRALADALMAAGGAGLRGLWRR